MLFQTPPVNVLTNCRSPVGCGGVFDSWNPGVVWMCGCVYFNIFLHLKKFFLMFIYFWLCQVLVAAHGSLVVVHGLSCPMACGI